MLKTRSPVTGPTLGLHCASGISGSPDGHVVNTSTRLVLQLLGKGHVTSKTVPNGKKVFTCLDPCKYCGKKQVESGHVGKRCPKNTTPWRGAARVQSTEVEFETPSATTPSATESRFTSLENDMASIKDRQNIMMHRIEEFFKQHKDF